MTYSIKQAEIIADQLERLATQNTHQLAGQVANIDFWIAEAVHAVHTIDDYPARFRRLHDAQVGWVEAHGTQVSNYCPQCEGVCEFGPETEPPPAPGRIDARELAAARDAVRRGSRRYLFRLYRTHFLDEDRVREACDQIGIGVEPEDFNRDPDPPS